MDQEQIERNIAFIIEQQAKFWADIEALKQERKEPDPRTERRLNRLERLFLLGIGAGRRERRERHNLDDKLNALISAQISSEDKSGQAKAEFDAKMAALAQAQDRSTQEFEAKMAALAEAQAKTDIVIQQSRRETEEFIQQLRRETEEFIQLSRRQSEVSWRKMEAYVQESRQSLDIRFDALTVAQAELTAAMAVLAQAMASTSVRVDAMSAK